MIELCHCCNEPCERIPKTVLCADCLSKDNIAKARVLSALNREASQYPPLVAQWFSFQLPPIRKAS